MKKYSLFFSLMIFVSCSNKGYPRFDYNNGPNPWINAFKDLVFYNCLHEGYQNEAIFDMIGKKDAYNSYDALSLESIVKAKELAKNLIRNMPPAVFCEDCKYGQKNYMYNALHYYRSRELDSVARIYYKRWLKTQADED